MALEVLLSAALAPILMVANTRAVFLTLRGRDVGWRPQRRDAAGLGWGDAFRAMTWQMLAGLAFTAGLWFRPDLAACFAPIVLPLLFAAPLAVLTSRRALGERFPAKDQSENDAGGVVIALPRQTREVRELRERHVHPERS